MEPKTQLDFLIEEFFNTGKLNLNKDEEGITFDQLEILTTLNESPKPTLGDVSAFKKLSQAHEMDVPFLMKGSKCNQSNIDEEGAECWIGEYIILIKTVLKNLYPDIIRDINGVFGERTKEAVIEFQKEHKLEADGIVGPTTLGFLFDKKYTYQHHGQHLTDTLGAEIFPDEIKIDSKVVLQNMYNSTSLTSLNTTLESWKILIYSLIKNKELISSTRQYYRSEKELPYFNYYFNEWITSKVGYEKIIINNLPTKVVQGIKIGEKKGSTNPDDKREVDNLILTLENIDNIPIDELKDVEYVKGNNQIDLLLSPNDVELIENFILEGTPGIIVDVMDLKHLGTGGKPGEEYKKYKVTLEEIDYNKKIGDINVGSNWEISKDQSVTQKHLKPEALKSEGDQHYNILKTLTQPSFDINSKTANPPLIKPLKLNLLWNLFNKLIHTLEESEEGWYKRAGQHGSTQKGYKKKFVEDLKRLFIYFIEKNGIDLVMGDINQLISFIETNEYPWEKFKDKLNKLMKSKENYDRILEVFSDTSREADRYQNDFFDNTRNPNTPFTGKTTVDSIAHHTGNRASSTTTVLRQLLTNMDIKVKNLIEDDEFEGATVEGVSFFSRNRDNLHSLLVRYRPQIENIINNISNQIRSADNPYQKADVYLTTPLRDENDEIVISPGNVEVKKLFPTMKVKGEDGESYTIGRESYMSEFYSYGKSKKNPFYIALNTKLKTVINSVYNYIIQQVYENIRDYPTIFDNLRNGPNATKAIILGDKYITPLSNIELYWSNKGQFGCHELRLAIRFYVKDPNLLYQLKFDPTNSTDNYTSVIAAPLDPFGGEPTKEICTSADNPVIGKNYDQLVDYLTSDSPINEEVNNSIESYISEALGF
jgi:peptidoglycan hydrolase-like protein with peptidoglycan-binding domain